MKHARVWLRKAILGFLVLWMGPQSHLWWGYDYRGQGMHQVSLILVVLIAAALCAGLYLITAGFVGLIARNRNYIAQWSWDLFLFILWGSLSVWGGVSARQRSCVAR